MIVLITVDSREVNDLAYDSGVVFTGLEANVMLLCLDLVLLKDSLLNFFSTQQVSLSFT